MLKYPLIIALIAFSAQIALSDEHSGDPNDGTSELVPPRKDVYQKLGITNGNSDTDREPAQEQPQRDETQPQQQQVKEDSGTPTPSAPDTSDQPIH